MTEQILTKVRFGHSPDPDDAFMFYAIQHKKIDLAGFEIEHVIQDIESLNRLALNAELEVTAVSVSAYAHLADRYAILRPGGSFGDQYGPIVVAKTPMSAGDLKGKTIAVPGTMTSAYLALKLFQPDFHEMVLQFDQIMDFVRDGEADAGLLIHEGQLTYADDGLEKIVDLGEWWSGKTNLPLPLGVDAIRKNIGIERMKAFSSVFKASIEYSLEHRQEALDYALRYGCGLTRERGDRFVEMYVNDYTRDLGPKGEEAIRVFLSRGFEAGILPQKITPEFI